MSTPDSPDSPVTPDDAAAESAPRAEAEPAWKRRQRLAAIFGDVLPEQTRDERDPEANGARENSNDAWLRSQVPPHHGHVPGT